MSDNMRYWADELDKGTLAAVDHGKAVQSCANLYATLIKSEDYFEFDFKPKGMKSKKIQLACDGLGRPVFKWAVMEKDFPSTTHKEAA